MAAVVGTDGSLWVSDPESHFEKFSRQISFENNSAEGESQEQTPNESPTFVDVVAGEGHFIAQTKEGKLVSWGSNNCGQCLFF